MRGILLLAAFVFASGAAAASVPSKPVAATPARVRLAPVFQLSGSVPLMPRPLPGTVLFYPGIFTQLRGPHGGLLAQRSPQPDESHLRG